MFRDSDMICVTSAQNQVTCAACVIKYCCQPVSLDIVASQCNFVCNDMHYTAHASLLGLKDMADADMSGTEIAIFAYWKLITMCIML